MKNYNLTTVWALLICAVFTTYGQNVSFNVDFTGSGYPAAGMQVSIGAYVGGWDTDLVILEENPNNANHYIGTYYGIPGNFEFRIYHNTIGGSNWGGAWITDMKGNPPGCDPVLNNESNYQYQIINNEDATLSFSLNGCYTVTPGLTLSNKSFDLVDFSVYPNPSEDFININTKEGVDSVSIYNLLGSEVLKATNYSKEGGLDVSALTSGVYVLVIESAGSKGTYKFVKK